MTELPPLARRQCCPTWTNDPHAETCGYWVEVPPLFQQGVPDPIGDEMRVRDAEAAAQLAKRRGVPDGGARITVRVEWAGQIHQCGKLILPEQATFEIVRYQLCDAADQVLGRLTQFDNQQGDPSARTH